MAALDRLCKMGAPSALSALADVYDMVPFYIKLIGHCLVVSSWFRQPFLREKYMLSYWVGSNPPSPPSKYTSTSASNGHSERCASSRLPCPHCHRFAENPGILTDYLT